MAKHFLYLTNDKLICHVWQRGTLVSREKFAVTEADGEAFQRHLARYGKLPTYLIVDLVEEDFRIDTIPALRGPDQQAILSRKLAQLYRNTPYRHAMVQEREREGRRDMRVLYHAVTNPDLLKPWLAALEQARVPLECVSSSPVLAGRLLKRLGVFFKNTLLVSIVPDLGLRQTYFQNKKIKFSRLTSLTGSDAGAMGAQIVAETSRTWQYLESLRNLNIDGPLEVCLLVHARDRQSLADAVRNFPLIQYRFLDIEEVAGRVGLRPAPIDSHAEAIFVHLFAQARIGNHFAAPALRRYATYRRMRMGLYSATTMTLATGVAIAGFNLYEANLITRAIERRNAEMGVLEKQYQGVSNSVKSQMLSSDTVRDTALFFANYMHPQPAPGPMLRELSQAFAGIPQIRLQQIVWTTGNDPLAMPKWSATPLRFAPAVQSEVQANATTAKNGINAPAASTSDPNAPYAGNKYHIALIEGTITPFDGDFRRALETVNRLVDRINLRERMHAAVVSLPLDTKPEALIRVADKAETAGRAEAGFVLRVQYNISTPE